MAHRLSFLPNRGVPLAVKVTQAGSALLAPYDPRADLSAISQFTQEEEVESELDLLALDNTPLDCVHSSEDSVWLRASFIDTLGRRVDVSANEVVPGTDEAQHFGGVATNLFRQCHDAERNVSGWRHQPLAVWARCNIRVNDALTDSDVLGVVTLSEGDSDASELAELIPPVITFDLGTTRIGHGNQRTTMPLQAAEDLGMPGWRLMWEDVSYSQAPVMAVRVEKGDTATNIARDLTVDLSAVLRANRLTEDDKLGAGELLKVPMLIRASTAAPKKEHPSVALTWKEIVKGWTTLN